VVAAQQFQCVKQPLVAGEEVAIHARAPSWKDGASLQRGSKAGA
jgi:hypothetical protein